MKPVIKVSLIVAGYLVAFMLAWGVVTIYVAMTSGPDRDASSGMYAFGDGMLFLGVFGIGAIPATGAMLYWLRPCRSFWRAISIAALLIAASGLTAVVDFVLARHASIGSHASSWCALAVLRILVAPLFGLAFLLSTILAPNRPSRIALFVATATEATGFAVWLGLLTAR